MSDDPVQKVDSAQAWTDFCELLKKAGDIILRDGLARSSFDRAEGHRYLLRLLRAGSQSFGELTGPLHPVFRAMPELVKMGPTTPTTTTSGRGSPASTRIGSAAAGAASTT